MGKNGSVTRRALSSFLNIGPSQDLYGPLIQSLISACGRVNSSSTNTLRGLRATGFFAVRTISGVITVRDQYETLRMLMGNQGGISISSIGTTGQASQG